MASFKLLVAVVLYYCFSCTMSQTSWEYQSLNRKINLMWRTFEKCSSFETEIRRLQFEMEDLKSELQTEKIKFEELRKQLPVSGYQTEGANQEPDKDRGRQATPVDAFNKLSNRLTLAMQSINNTVNRVEGYDIIIQSLQNDSTTTKSIIATTASTVDQIQRYVSNKFNQPTNVSALVTIISHAFEEEKIKRKHVEDELKQSISSKMFDLQINQRHFRERMLRSLGDVIADINTTVEVSKREVLINITDAWIATQTLFKTKMDTVDAIASSTKSLLCGNGYIKFGLDKTPVCECETGYSGVHCSNAPAPKRYRKTRADVVIILDASTSVTDDNFQKMLDFSKNLVDKADVDSGRDRFGVLVFSTKKKIVFHLKKFKTKAAVKGQIDQIQYLYGSTNTAIALKIMHSKMFTAANGDRPNADNIAFLITDGISNINSSRTNSEAEIAKAKGNHIYAIGIGIRDIRELKSIASKPSSENTFDVGTFNGLKDLARKIWW